MARDQQQSPPSTLDKAAASVADRLIDLGIGGVGPFDPARDVADATRAASRSVEDAVDAVVAEHTRLVAAGGFVTGLGGFVTLPVALPANVVGFYLVAARMVAAIAHLHGHDLQAPQIRTALLVTLVGGDADDILAKAGVVAPGGRVARLALQRLPAPALMMVNKGIAFRLVSRLVSRGVARLGRAVPFVGGAVGAGLDAYLLRRIATAAKRELAEV